MLFPGRPVGPVPGTVGRFARMPTTDRGRMSSSKAPVSRAATQALFSLLMVLDGAVAMREPLPLSTWYALEQRDWRIASTKHANSYLFRVDRGEDGGAGICTPATVGACCGDSATHAWYMAAAGKSTPPWIAAAGFKHADGRPLTSSLDAWARGVAVLVPGKVSGSQQPWKNHIDPVIVAALPGDTWCVARWNPATRRLEPRRQRGERRARRRPATYSATCLASSRLQTCWSPIQVGTALLFLADVTISQIGLEIASGQCVRSGSAGVPPPPTCSPSGWPLGR